MPEAAKFRNLFLTVDFNLGAFFIILLKRQGIAMPAITLKPFVCSALTSDEVLVKTWRQIDLETLAVYFVPVRKELLEELQFLMNVHVSANALAGGMVNG